MIDNQRPVTPFRVLIAESDWSVLGPYRDALAHDGFEVVTARDGLDCLAKLRSFVPHVLVLRNELPWGRSDGVLALMAEEPDIPEVPAIVISSRASAASPEIPRATGTEPVFHTRTPSPLELAKCVCWLRAAAGRRFRR